MEECIIVTFLNMKTGDKEDLEIPIDITANDLIFALEKIYHLECSCDKRLRMDGFLKCENPIALLKGERCISDYGLYDGTIIMYS